MVVVAAVVTAATEGFPEEWDLEALYAAFNTVRGFPTLLEVINQDYVTPEDFVAAIRDAGLEELVQPFPGRMHLEPVAGVRGDEGARIDVRAMDANVGQLVVAEA